MSRQLRIACIGGESTGKTTLAAALAASVGGVLVPEVLRAFVVDHGRSPVQEEQRALLDQQRALEQATAERHDGADIVCDPASLMIAVYSELYFDDRSLYPTALAFARDYDALLWCRPDIPWVPEPGQHDGPLFRTRADELLQRWVIEHEDEFAVLKVTGTTSRVEGAQAQLKALLGSVWQPSTITPPT